MIIKLQNGDKIKIESTEKAEARRKYKEHSLLSIGLKLKRNLNIASSFLKSGPSITNFGNAVSALLGDYNPENPDVIKGDPPNVGIKDFTRILKTARVAREFNDVVKGPVNLFKLLNNFIEKFVTNPKGSGKLIHYDKGNGKSVYQKNRGASIINSKLVPGKTKREGLKDYTWWNTDNPYINVHKAKEGPFSPTRYIVVDENTLFKHPFNLKEPVGQSAGKGRGFIIKTERVTDKPVDLTNAEIYEKSPFGWWEKIKVLPSKSSKLLRVISEGTYPMYRGRQHSVREVVNLDGTVNPRQAMKILHEVSEQFPGSYKMEHRLENPEWHQNDPTTYHHTKNVARSAWYIDPPLGFTKQDLMIAALGHDFGKIVAGDGHAQIGADLAKQVFPDLTDAQYTAIVQHMKTPTTPLGKVTKLADINNGRHSYSGYTPTKLSPIQSKFVKDVMQGHKWGMNKKIKPTGNRDFTKELKSKERLGYGAENDVYKDVSNPNQVLKVPGDRNGFVTPHSTPLGAIKEGLYIIRPFNRLPYNLPLNVEGTILTAEGKYIPVFSLRKVYVPLMDQPKIIDFDKSVNGMYSIAKPDMNNILLENDIQRAKDFKLPNIGFLPDGTVMGIDLWKKGGKMKLLFLKNGSGIHIKKKNRGKFTSYCGGKVTGACIAKAKASGNPTLIKRATFAANARKWKHLKGGELCLISRS